MIPSTPFPSVLIDAAMPTLRDTEWRVLCVVVRSTLGWKLADGRRKRRDWMTHSQLVRRTGRSSDAVSRAVAALVRRGLVTATGAAGDVLDTPEKRRRYRGRISYGVTIGADR